MIQQKGLSKDYPPTKKISQSITEVTKWLDTPRDPTLGGSDFLFAGNSKPIALAKISKPSAESSALGAFREGVGFQRTGRGLGILWMVALDPFCTTK